MATSGSSSTSTSSTETKADASVTPASQDTATNTTSEKNDVSPSNDTSSGTRPAGQDDPKTLTDAEKYDQDRLVAITAQPVTARDAMGIERIVAPAPEGYDEPQVEPDPHEVARLERLQGLLTSAADKRLQQLTTSPDGSARVAADAIKAEGNVGVASAS